MNSPKTSAAREVGRQRELRDDEHASPDVREIEVHLSVLVVEYTQAVHPPRGLLCGRGVISFLGAKEHEKAPPDPADAFIPDPDLRFGDPLDHKPHGDAPGRRGARIRRRRTNSRGSVARSSIATPR